MTISTYSELKTAIENFMLRPGDTVVSDRADEFIDLCEAQMMRGMEPPFPFPTKPLRARQMETRKTDYSIDAEYVNLPTGFLEHIDLYTDTSPRNQLEYVSPQMFDMLYASTQTGDTPDIFTIVGSQARFAPAPASAVTAIFTYYQEITPLDGTNTSNWILADAPHVYLYGSLMQAYWLTDQDLERVGPAAAAFAGGLNSLRSQEQRSRRARTVVARTLTGTP